MSERKVQIPPVHKRLLSLRWYRRAVDSESTETNKQWKNWNHGNIFNQKQEVFADRNNGGLTKEQINFLVFRAGRATSEGIFRGTEDGSFFPDVAPRVEHFMEDDIRQIRCILVRGYRSYEVDKASVWRMLYYAELLMKGYTLRGLVSRGDFGVVYSATFDGANCKARVAEEIAKDGATKVGIKIIDKSETHWYQVRNEIAAHASTSGHQNVLKLYQVFHTATAIYLVQEFPGRGSLASVVPRNGFTEQECRDFMKGILHGLRHLQRLEVVHRNLTCANILLTNHGSVKIAEFGLACVLPDRDFLLHQRVGTSGYMAPEILRGLRYNGFLSDIWSIGIVLYFLLHKFPPFTDEDLTLYNCWHCLDFTHRSLSVDLCLLLRSILQFRPTARPSLETILRHDWLAHDDKPRLKSLQVRDSVSLRPSVQPERLNSGLIALHHSSSVQSLQDKEKELQNEKTVLGPCWVNLMHSNGQNRERITLKSRLISQTQQDKINRLERKLKAKNKDQRKLIKPQSSHKTAVLPDLGITQPTKKKQQQPVFGDEETGEPPSSSMLPASVVNETPLDPDPGDGGRGKGVYCNSQRCLREIQTQRMLFETSSISHRSSMTIPVRSVSEDDEDNYEHERNKEMKAKDEETKTKRLGEETNRDKDNERNATMENGDNTTNADEDISGIAEQYGETQSLTVEKSRSSYEDATQIEGRLLSEEEQISPRIDQSGRRSSLLVASSHQVKELSSERRLIASIRNLWDSTTSHGETISSLTSSYRSNEDYVGYDWQRHSGFGLHTARTSLDALDEVPAEYAAGLDVEDDEHERLINTQYYNQLDLPSMSDNPLEAEQQETIGAALQRDRSLSEATVDSQHGSLESLTDDVQRFSQDGTPLPPLLTYDAVESWVKAIRSGSLICDSSSSLFHPELAINWDSISSGVCVSCDDPSVIAPLKEMKTKSRTTIVSKAPSLRAITEEHHASGGGRGAGVGGAGGRLPEKLQTQESLRKTDILSKRTSESFPSQTKSKDLLLSSSTSSVGRLQTQAQIQIQEQRSESAVWESISTRGIARASYPKLAASVACETSLHSIVELNIEKDIEQLEHDNRS